MTQAMINCCQYQISKHFKIKANETENFQCNYKKATFSCISQVSAQSKVQGILDII